MNKEHLYNGSHYFPDYTFFFSPFYADDFAVFADEWKNVADDLRFSADLLENIADNS